MLATDETKIPFRGNPLAVLRIQYAQAGRGGKKDKSSPPEWMSPGRHAAPTSSSLKLFTLDAKTGKAVQCRPTRYGVHHRVGPSFS